MKKPAESPRAAPTPDGHHVVIDGRKWRATNPNLPEDVRQKLVNELMSARRAVGAALKSKDDEAEKAARARVNEAKIALGERGRNGGKRSLMLKNEPRNPAFLHIKRTAGA